MKGIYEDSWKVIEHSGYLDSCSWSNKQDTERSYLSYWKSSSFMEDRLSVLYTYDAFDKGHSRDMPIGLAAASCLEGKRWLFHHGCRASYATESSVLRKVLPGLIGGLLRDGAIEEAVIVAPRDARMLKDVVVDFIHGYDLGYETEARVMRLPSIGTANRGRNIFGLMDNAFVLTEDIPTTVSGAEVYGASVFNIKSVASIEEWLEYLETP